MRKRKTWTEKDKKKFISLLKKYCLAEAARRFSKYSDRNVETILRWFHRHKSEIPEEILNSCISRQNKLWSKEENETLLGLIEKYPYNFMKAYRIHSENTGRTVSSIAQHFMIYRNKDDSKVCMFTFGRKKYAVNRKNIHIKTGGDVNSLKVSKWRTILQLIFSK